MPLYKNGAVFDLCNYCPILVLPVLLKFIESYMHNFLYSNNFIFSKQSNFHKNYSTETALINLIDDFLLNLDKDRVFGVVLIQYCEAFDMVNHELLLKKLEACRHCKYRA